MSENEHVCTQAALIQQIAKQVDEMIGNDREDNKLISKYITLSEMNVETNKELSKAVSDLSATVLGVSSTLEKMNLSIDEMNQEIKSTNIRMDKLENKLNISEDKSIIKVDTRDIIKKFFTKLFFPVSSISAIIYFIYKLIKNLIGGE